MIPKSDINISQLHRLIQDAKRFIFHNQETLQKDPGQLYTSMLLFAPRTSITKKEVGECNEMNGVTKLKDY